MLRLVLDTNTLVSGFFWDGKEAELLRRIEKRKARLYISKSILEEFRHVIQRPKFAHVFQIVPYSIDNLIDKFVSMSTLIKIKNKVNICRDKADNKFIECALSCSADFIVSGDKDLLVLKKYKKIKIVRTSAILKLLD